jgi:hypothetical protein
MSALTMFRVCRIGTAENTASSDYTEICDRDEYLVGGANHDDIAAIQTESLEAASQSPDPVEQLSWGQVFGRILAVEPERLP